jgi:AAA ATPase domain
MLFGREGEAARIAEVLDAARAGRSGALVVRGAAGIGKSALLNAAVEGADGMRVLRALGVESEVDVACLRLGSGQATSRPSPCCGGAHCLVAELDRAVITTRMVCRGFKRPNETPEAPTSG